MYQLLKLIAEGSVQMILDQQLEGILQPDEQLLGELRGILDIPAINATQTNGRLFATNTRLIFLCDVENQLRYDSFNYTHIERIAMRRSFKNEPRLLFEADDEIQMLHSIQNIENLANFMETVEKHME